MQDMVNLNVNINMKNLNEKYKAKPNKGIVEHTQEVLAMGMELCKKLHFQNESEEKIFKNELAITLILHDIGKISVSFQNYVNTNDLENYKIQHNVLSWIFINYNLNTSNNRINLDNIKANVLYHHFVADFNDSDITTELIKGRYDDMVSFFNTMCEYCDINNGTELRNIFKIESNVNNVKTIDSMNLFDTIDDSDNFQARKRILGRSILQKSDRVVSGANASMDNNINPRFPIFEELDLSCYSDKKRLKQQLDITKEMVKLCNSSEVKTHVVSASTGYGKTLLGLLWIYQNRQKVFWIVPRKEIADNTYNSILDDLENIGCGNKMNVSLFYSGTIINKNFTTIKDTINESDIIVTIIDNPFNFNFKNNLSDKIYEIYNRVVIFDEYHEFALHNNAPLFSEFILQMRIRALNTKAQTLLLSATPLNINKLVGLNDKGLSVNVKYYDTDIYGGDLEYNLRFIKLNEMFDIIDNETAVFLPRRKDSQDKYLEVKKYAENNSSKLSLPITFNGTFTDDDRHRIIEEIKSMFGKKAKNPKRCVITTSVLSTSVDVSFKNVILFAWKPSDFIQILGRVNRFGEYTKNVNVYIVNPFETNDNDKLVYKNDYHHLQRIDSKAIARLWIDTLKNKIGDGIPLTKDGIYTMYNKFEEKYTDQFDKYYNIMFSESLKNLRKMKLKRGYSVDRIDDDSDCILSCGITHRGDSNNVWCAIPRNDDTDKFEVLSYDLDLISDDTVKILKQRQNFMKKYCNNKEAVVDYTSVPKNYLNKKFIHLVAKNNQAMINMVRNRKQPLYTPQLRYSSEIGIYEHKN